jgi:hypothetical protein
MRCDHHDAVALGQVTIQTVTIIGPLADQSSRETVEETVSEDAFDKLAFVRRIAFDTDGELQTMVIGESDDFRSLAALGGPRRDFEGRDYASSTPVAVINESIARHYWPKGNAGAAE